MRARGWAAFWTISGDYWRGWRCPAVYRGNSKAKEARVRVVGQFEFPDTNSICPSAKSIGVTRPYT
jgi:hypothetical protein